MTATEHLAQLAFQAGGGDAGVNKVNRRGKSEDTPPLPTPSSPKLSEAVSSCQEDKASFHSSEMMDQVDDEADEVEEEAGTGGDDEKDKLKRIEKSFDLEKLKPDPQYADERTKPRQDLHTRPHFKILVTRSFLTQVQLRCHDCQGDH